MTVHFDQSDIVSLRQFGGIDYLIPAHAKRLALDQVLSQVTLLDWSCGKRLVRTFHAFERYPQPFDWTKYHVTSFVAFDHKAGQHQEQVSEWLQTLPIAMTERVYVYRITKEWEAMGCPTFVVSWHDFALDVWYYTWNVFDVITVIDDTARWAVIIGPESFAVFVTEGPVDSHLPKSDPAYGLGLLRVK